MKLIGKVLLGASALGAGFFVWKNFVPLKLASGSTYIVKFGDTLSNIARRSGWSLAAWRAWNPRVVKVTPGQALLVPSTNANRLQAIAQWQAQRAAAAAAASRAAVVPSSLPSPPASQSSSAPMGDRDSSQYGGRRIVGSSGPVGQGWVLYTKAQFELFKSTIGGQLPIQVNGLWRGNDYPPPGGEASDMMPPDLSDIAGFWRSAILTVSFTEAVPIAKINQVIQTANALGVLANAVAGNPLQLSGAPRSPAPIVGQYTIFFDKSEIYPGDAPTDIRTRDQSL